MRILLLGTLAALFFSATFVLNRAMSLAGGPWVWSASLRYFWMLGLLCGGLLLSGRGALLADALRLYARHWRFWTLAGSVGFGCFYALITFSSTLAPGWVVAATWQTTILATPLVLLAFGRRVPLRALLLTGIIFAGIVLVNLEQTDSAPVSQVLLGALPVLLAAFAYPFGNQLVWEAQSGGSRYIPALNETPEALRVMADPFCRVLLLTLGSLPLWAALLAVTCPPPPEPGQLLNTFLVAVFSGVLATSLFLAARHRARSSAQLAAVDCTQSMEVIFSLAGEITLLGAALPGPLGWTGISLTMLGLVLYIRVQNIR